MLRIKEKAKRKKEKRQNARRLKMKDGGWRMEGGLNQFSIFHLPFSIPFFFFLLTFSLVTGCRTREDLTLHQEQQQVLRSFQPVEYRRSGGLVAADERVSISKDGKLTARGRFV